MPKTKKIPLRQCIACRQLKEKRQMLRVVKNQAGDIFLDLTSKAQGRGAYVCDDVECIKKLRKQRLINKVFSCEVHDDVYLAIEETYLGKN